MSRSGGYKCYNMSCNSIVSHKTNANLLARAEAAEARCETLEKMVKEYQDKLIPGYRERAEKAKRERDALLKEFAGECGMCVHYEDCTQNHYSCCDGADWEWIGLKEE